ncbi:hypothetical protein [Thiobacillus sp. 65-1402]|nr:hypothetical protein [Thiobacillus sp. 65-1402]
MNATLLRTVLTAAAEQTGWSSAGTAAQPACTIALAMAEAPSPSPP